MKKLVIALICAAGFSASAHAAPARSNWAATAPTTAAAPVVVSAYALPLAAIVAGGVAAMGGNLDSTTSHE